MQQRSDGVIVLTLFMASDAPVLYVADHDAEFRLRFEFPDDFVPSLRHSENVISLWEQERLTGKRFPFAVREAATGTLLGGCDLLPIGDKASNLSYWTYPEHRGRGIASRAAILACGIAFEEMGFQRLEALTDRDNIGSRRVAVRSGFKEVGERDGRILHILEKSWITK